MQKSAIKLLLGPLIFLSSQALWAINTPSTGYKSLADTQMYVWADNSCHEVINDSANDYFVPTKTPLEWNSFVANTPLNVSVKNGCPSCQAISQTNMSGGSGVYNIDIDSGGAELPFPVYCDMTTDGGGWTLVWSNTRGGTNKPTTNIDWNTAINTKPRCSRANSSDALDTSGDCTYISNDLEGFNYYIGLEYWNKITSYHSHREIMYRWNNDYLSPIDYEFRADFSKFRTDGLYKLDFSNYQNTVGSLDAGLLSTHDKRSFSTTDLDNDIHQNVNTHCATNYSNTPYWYKNCWSGSINGGGENSGGSYYNGAYWTGSSKTWGADDGTGAGNGWIFVREHQYPANCLDILQEEPTSSDGVYTVDPDGPGAEPPLQVYCDMTTDGGGWTLIFNHDIIAGYFTDSNEALSSNPGDPQNDKYSIIGKLDAFQNSGSYTFKINWPGYAGRNIWAQKSNPTQDVDVEGYVPINIDHDTNYWGGLELSTGTHGPSPATENTLLDGSVNHDNWWFAIGSYTSFGDPAGLPSSSNISPDGVEQVQLWFRPEVPLRSCFDIKKAGRSKGDGHYIIDVDGIGGAAPFKVYCDMTTDGGGWTLAWHGYPSEARHADYTNEYYKISKDIPFDQIKAEGTNLNFHVKDMTESPAILRNNIPEYYQYVSGLPDSPDPSVLFHNPSGTQNVPLGLNSLFFGYGNMWRVFYTCVNVRDTADNIYLGGSYAPGCEPRSTFVPGDISICGSGGNNYCSGGVMTNTETDSGLGLTLKKYQETKVWLRNYRPKSCKQILDDGFSGGDGSYVIDPDGVGGNKPVRVYCDMTNGGWTLVFSHDNSSFDSGVWSSISASRDKLLSKKWGAPKFGSGHNDGNVANVMEPLIQTGSSKIKAEVRRVDNNSLLNSNEFTIGRTNPFTTVHSHSGEQMECLVSDDDTYRLIVANYSSPAYTYNRTLKAGCGGSAGSHTLANTNYVSTGPWGIDGALIYTPGTNNEYGNTATDLSIHVNWYDDRSVPSLYTSTTNSSQTKYGLTEDWIVDSNGRSGATPGPYICESECGHTNKSQDLFKLMLWFK